MANVFEDSEIVISPKYGINNLINGGTNVMPNSDDAIFVSNRNDDAFSGYFLQSWGIDIVQSIWFSKTYAIGDFVRIAMNWVIEGISTEDRDYFLFDGQGLLYKCSIGFEAHIDGSQITTSDQLSTWHADPKGQIKLFIYDGVTKTYVTDYAYKDNCSVVLELTESGDVSVVVNGGEEESEMVGLTIAGTSSFQYIGGGDLANGEDYSATLDYFEFKIKNSAFMEPLQDYANRIYAEWTPKETFLLDLGITRALGTNYTYKGAGLIYVSDLLNANRSITSIINNTTGVITGAKCFGNILIDGDISIAESGEQTDFQNNMGEIEQSYIEKKVEVSGFTLIENKTPILEDAIVSLLDTDNQYTFYITSYKDSDTSAIPDKIYIIPSGNISGNITETIGDKVLMSIEGLTIEGSKHPSYKRVITKLDYNSLSGKYE